MNQSISFDEWWVETGSLIPLWHLTDPLEYKRGIAEAAWHAACANFDHNNEALDAVNAYPS